MKRSPILLPDGEERAPKPEPDEKPESFVTSDAEAMHAATIRGACEVLNDAVRAAAKDGLQVQYEGRHEGSWGMWTPMTDGPPPALLLSPVILRRL